MFIRGLTTAVRIGGAAVLASALATTSASAAIVTYTLSGQLTGALGGATLTDTPFTWTTRANSLSLTSVSGDQALKAVSSDIQLGGLGDAIFAQPISVLKYGDAFAFADQAVANGVAWISPAFPGEPFVAALSSQATDFSVGVGALDTSLGAFSVSNATGLTFSATVSSTPPLRYTLTGDLSGSFDGQSFENAPFSWALTTDTNTLSDFQDVPALNVLSDVLHLSGFGDFAPTADFQVALDTTIPDAGFVASSPEFEGIIFHAPVLANYALGEALAGLPLELTDANFIDTSRGRIDISGVRNLRLSAAPASGAPEPSAWAVMLLGFGGLGAMLRRRRAYARSILAR